MKMTYGKMKIQMAKEGDLVTTPFYDNCEVVKAFYNQNLNWFTYQIKTPFGIKEIENNSLTELNGVKI